MNYYPRHIGDYARDAGHLTALEHGIYTLLMDWYYVNEQPIPDDKAHRLARSTREDTLPILQEFFTLVDGAWRHTRIEKEIAAYYAKKKKAKDSAKASVQSRREKSETTNRELRAARLAAAKSKASHTDEQWQWLLDVCGHRCVRCGSADALQRDHITPIYQGGSDGIDNIQPLCKACNTGKGAENQDFRPANWSITFSERSANAQRTLSGGSALQKPIANSHYSEDSDASASGATAPDERDLIWSQGVRLITASGKPEAAARSFLGGQVKARGSPAVANAVTQALINKPVEPMAYIAEVANASDRPERNTGKDTSAAGRVRANVKRELDALAAARAGGDGLAVNVQPIRPPLD